MRITVRFFGPAAEAAGRAELPLKLPERSTVSDAVAELRRLLPPMAPLLNGATRCAVGTTYVEPRRPLAEGEELSVIPPVGGG